MLYTLLPTLLTFAISQIAFAAETKPDLNTIKVCRRMGAVLKPKGITSDACYNQAKKFLKEKKVQVMAGSYQAYFALAEKDKTQTVCYNFFKELVQSTQEFELEDAKMLFENDKGQSLDQSYFSYQTCADNDKKLKAAAAESSTPNNTKSNTGTTN